MATITTNGRKAVYTIIDREGQKSIWLRIGIAFVNRDQSINVLLDALPVNGKLQVRDFAPREAEDGVEPIDADQPPLTE